MIFLEAIFITCCSWLACTHTGYSLTLVPVTVFIPRKVGALHLLADLCSHLLAALFLKNRFGHGIFFLWHTVKYALGQTNVPRMPAYLLDLADCLLWQAVVFSFSTIYLFLPPAVLYVSLWAHRILWKGEKMSDLRRKGGASMLLG